MKKVFAFALVFALGTTALFAQEVTDEQFDKFAKAFQTVQQENNKAQMEMVAVIEEEGLTAERFNTIHQASIDPNTESDATDKEKKQHQAALSKLEAKNEKLQAQMEEKIKASGLSMEKYQEIYQLVQTDPEMQQKLMERFQSQGQK